MRLEPRKGRNSLRNIMEMDNFGLFDKFLILCFLFRSESHQERLLTPLVAGGVVCYNVLETFFRPVLVFESSRRSKTTTKVVRTKHTLVCTGKIHNVNFCDTDFKCKFRTGNKLVAK